MKNILIFCSCIALAIIMGACSKSCTDDTAKKAIVALLKQDHQACTNASSIAEIPNNQRKISLKSCPEKIRKAYRKHIQAWEEMASVEREMQQWKNRYDSGSAYVEAFLRGMIWDFSMVGEANDAFEKIKEHHNQASRAIKETFYEVLDLADSYGVDTEEYRNKN